MGDSFIIKSYDQPPADWVGLIDDGLERYNLASAPLSEVASLSVFAVNEPDQVIGGACGRTWGQCCELQQIWVADELQNRGIGTSLVSEFETQARQRGCRVFFLETFSFQSPEWYEWLGYSVQSRIDGFPDGIAKFLMLKDERS